MTESGPDEIVLAQIWNGQWLSTPLRLHDGRDLRIVYRGVWAHGLGPDFSNAFIDIAGSLARGAVEIHRRSSDWFSHGHQLDPAYNDVVLHVVWQDDLGQPVRRVDGRSVPTMLLSDFLPGPLAEFAANPILRPLGAIGFDYCAPVVASRNPDALRTIWERAGDERMRLKIDAAAARLAGEPPAQVLYAILLDALGYSRNRDGMRAVAERLPYDHLDARLIGATGDERFERAAGLLLGVAGFLPLSPRECEFAGLSLGQDAAIEEAWVRLGAAWREIRLASSSWSLARVRPAGHPIRRLLGLARFLARLQEGIVEELCDLTHQTAAYAALQRWLISDNPYLGRAHAHEIIVNVIVPFTLAYSDLTEQAELAERTIDLWSTLPAGQGNATIKRMVEQICGPNPLRVGSARAEQGLLHLHATGCLAMRCFECPVAHIELMSTPNAPDADSPAFDGNYVNYSGFSRTGEPSR